jgi:large subunit ribosomal protein L25
VSDQLTLAAEIRTEFGKGAARRARRAGRIPAVLYGHGQPPTHVTLSAREFASAIRRGGMTHVLTLALSDGTEVTALPKAIQRDPVRDTVEHADLLLVRRGEKVTVEIPVQLTGEPAKGTLVIHEVDRVAVSADATQLPDHLEASIDGLDVGGRVTAAQVVLPEGVDLVSDPDTVIAVISVAPTADEMAEAPAEAAEGAEARSAESS